MDPKVVVKYLYDSMRSNATVMSSNRGGRMVTPFPAKNIKEVPGLIETVLNSVQDREEVNKEDRVLFTTELPDFEKEMEAITYAVTKRKPGGLGNGAPFEQQAKNLRPILREESTDPDDPDYKVAIYGHFFDNLIKLTCWAHSSWQAEKRALWLEDAIRDYTWWLTMQGVSRIFYFGRDEDLMLQVSKNKIYGKPLVFFVRTERLSEVSTKKLEQLVIKVATQGG